MFVSSPGTTPFVGALFFGCAYGGGRVGIGNTSATKMRIGRYGRSPSLSTSSGSVEEMEIWTLARFHVSDRPVRISDHIKRGFPPRREHRQRTLLACRGRTTCTTSAAATSIFFFFFFFFQTWMGNPGHYDLSSTTPGACAKKIGLRDGAFCGVRRKAAVGEGF